ncbi:MAG: hypothetical protein J6J75_02225, partial [Alistipes sp.]|nr:hypothetical protein [Alistipes sp.]
MKHNILYRIFVCCAALGLVLPFAGCDKESNVEQPTEIMLSVAPLTLEFEAETESKTVKIATDGDRWIFLDGYPSWIDVVEDGDVLTVTVEKNETGATRSGLIDIKAIRGSDSRTKSIVVRQYAEGDAPDDGYVHFGDDAFEELILGYYDANGDGRLSLDEAKRITQLDVADSDIKSLRGVERFSELVQLECEYNALTSLNVGGLAKLQYLICDHNAIASLNIEGCTSLTSIICSDNKITSLNVKDVCKGLEFLNCGRNKLTRIDVSGMKSLQHFYCEMNEIAAVDVGGCTAMTTLVCHRN